MYRDKATLSALIVSSSQKAADYLQDILSRLRFTPVANAVSIAEAKRRQLEYRFDLVIINAPLPDDFGLEFAEALCTDSSVGVILFVKAELLEQVGMGDRRRHLPNELSGGQKQRVAIARAMANDPAILLADEPTGALDTQTGRMVMDLFHRLHREQGKTILLITHNPELAAETDRIITISDGRIVGQQKGGAV